MFDSQEYVVRNSLKGKTFPMKFEWGENLVMPDLGLHELSGLIYPF